jgi:hypothetical protein
MKRALALLVVVASPTLACGTLESSEVAPDAGGAASDDGAAASEPDGALSDASENVADADAGPDAAGPLADGASCVIGGAPCLAGSYCASPTCDVGTCQPKSPAVNDSYGPVCGCDGLTYWNAGYAVSAGTSVRGANPCTRVTLTTQTCELGGQACPAGTYCGVSAIVTMCSTTTAGICWVVPSPCPIQAGGAASCGNLACASVCAAMMSGSAYYNKAGCN